MTDVKAIVADIDLLVERIGRERRNLIALLQAIQKNYNYLPAEALERVCETTDIRPADITSVSTFYSQFRTRPAGAHFINVCIGTACHVKGANTIYDAFRRELKIEGDSDTDADKLFTIQKVACLGCCMLAPAVQIDKIIYGFVTPNSVARVLREFLSSLNAAPESTDALKPAALPSGEVRMCLCSSCGASGAAETASAFKRRIEENALPARFNAVGCDGASFQAPAVSVALDDGRSFRYANIEPRHVDDVLNRHFQPASAFKRVKGAVQRLLESAVTTDDSPLTRYGSDARDRSADAYLDRQVRIVTEGAGRVDPLDLDGYEKNGGFAALKDCAGRDDPSSAIKTILDSGLRGRGGGGFPTGRKWTMVRDSAGTEKTVIVNGDEGDPGAFMDRMVLESYPFRVIEGAVIAALSVGASNVLFYIRAEYPLATQRVRAAIELCRARGYVCENVCGTGRRVDVHVHDGAGAFVCGEETALIAALEGKRGSPRFRPPYPAQSGYNGLPTLVNNVETLATVPWIIRNGATAFRKIGTATSPGTKTFALAGKVRFGGLIEVPMGMTLRQIVEEIGGGIEGGGKLKAVQVGGPSGGCVPASLADTPVDFEALLSTGSMMGSGGMVVLDENDCMVDVARYFLAFTQHESCGKCAFCRIGTKRMLEILERLCVGDGKKGDIESLESLAKRIQTSSLCGLGKTAPNPALTTIKYFRDEYEAHIEGRCPAKLCKPLIRYVVTDKCIGCTICAQRCPVDAIAFRPHEKHEIDVEKCTRCNVCKTACPVKAIEIRTPNK